jgi:hydrogenase/urease accessory protein HupE
MKSALTWAAKTASVLAVIAGLSALPSRAHEVRPAYLELVEGAPGRFDVLLKTPMVGDMRLSLAVAISPPVEVAGPIVSRVADKALLQTWQARADDHLAGRTIRVVGLENTISDALLRVQFSDGRSWTHRLTPASPSAEVPAAPGGADVAATYAALGVEHILFGYDHLLFVLCLLLISTSTRQLVQSITAFTAAHSITLAAAVLGFVHVPPKPVEAAIALSIAFLASEILRGEAGKPGLAARAPWVVAFGFGLLHGLGFAGALSEIGIPAGHVPLALLFFNLGVEAGQLAFVACVLALLAAIRLVRMAAPPWAPRLAPYAIGSVATFWVIQRVSVF